MRKVLFVLKSVLFVLGISLVGWGMDTGTVKVTLQDAPANVEKLEVPIVEIAVHFVPKGSDKKAADEDPAEASNDPQKAGWRSILLEEKTFDLIALKDNPVDIGSLQLGEGKITQIRLVISQEKKTMVTISGQQFEVSVPSNVARINKNIDVVIGQETLIPLDFDVETALKETGKDTYKLDPVLKLVEK